MSVTIKTVLDGSGVRAGLQALASEGRTFRDTFKKNIESGGGLFGSIDSALGKLAGGRFAAPVAAIGAGLVIIQGLAGGIEKHWENIAESTERARQNIDAIESTRSAVSGQRFSGESANAALARDIAGKRAAAQAYAADAALAPDPTEVEGRAKFARNMSGTGFAGFWDFLRLTASQYIPGMGKPMDEASAEYNARQDRMRASAQDLAKAEQLRPYVEFANRTEQRGGQSALIAAEDRLGVSQGRITGFEAAANKLLFASAQYQDALRTYGSESDPRVQSARASALEAFTTYDAELSTARRFRNDPTIAADSLARLGGGGGVNIFGDGRGELLFEQKRLNQSTLALTKEIQALNVTLSKGFGFDVN